MNLPTLEQPQLPTDLDAPCLTHRQFADYGDDLKRWKDLWKSLNDQRLEQTRPLDEAKKKIIAWFDGPINMLNDAITRRRAQMKRFELEQEKKNEAIRKEAEAKGEIALTATAKAEGISTRKVWKWRITDESKVPEYYWSVDADKVNQIVRSNKEHTAIPGIEVYFEESTIVRTK